jgi:hypothetical protein
VGGFVGGCGGSGVVSLSEYVFLYLCVSPEISCNK